MPKSDKKASLLVRKATGNLVQKHIDIPVIKPRLKFCSAIASSSTSLLSIQTAHERGIMPSSALAFEPVVRMPCSSSF